METTAAVEFKPDKLLTEIPGVLLMSFSNLVFTFLSIIQANVSLFLGTVSKRQE